MGLKIHERISYEKKMDKEVERAFLSRVRQYLISLPFDLKILQEAVADPELERPAREFAAAVVIHAMAPHEGQGPERYVEDVLLARVALERIQSGGGEGAAPFCTRFPECYETLAEDLAALRAGLGDELWGWLCTKAQGFGRLHLKGKSAARCIDDESAQEALYEEGLEFLTAYNVTEEQVQNRLRRPEPIIQHLQRRHQDDARRR